MIPLCESVMLKAIIRFVPYTEIDYQAYMEQIEMITVRDQLDYSKIKGSTGPLVYPAGHVWLYRLMYWLTDGMNNVKEGQAFFSFLYLLTMVSQVVLYQQLSLPPWCAILACFSKRLHSIYVLRLFNDCFTTLYIIWTVLLLVIAAKQTVSKRAKKLLAFAAAITYSIAVSIKMNALLYLPAVTVSLYLVNGANLALTAINVLTILAWQILVALPFLRSHPYDYLQCAFNFRREFMYKWSVNWQFLDEDGFQNPWFHRMLLLSQFVSILTIILITFPALPAMLLRSLRRPATTFPTLLSESPIAFVLVATNFAGVLFSRSLHYQFLSWYHWTIPCLFHYARIPWLLAPAWYFAHEWCWNSFPPNSAASALLFTLNASLLLSLVCHINSTTPPPHSANKKLQ